jgi:uncharacterized membrane protein (UPF0127 family)
VLVATLGWLRRDGEVLASLEIADDRRARRQGLLGRDGVDGGLLLPSCRSVHTFGMAFPIDVALCAPSGPDQLVVVATRTLRPGRVTMPRLRASVVIEAEAGSFARWGLEAGDTLVVERSDGER